LPFLARLAFDRRHLDARRYEHAARAINEVGGAGWRLGQSQPEALAATGSRFVAKLPNIDAAIVEDAN
jgi:hypothetical protein